MISFNPTREFEVCKCLIFLTFNKKLIYSNNYKNQYVRKRPFVDITSSNVVNKATIVLFFLVLLKFRKTFSCEWKPQQKLCASIQNTEIDHIKWFIWLLLLLQPNKSNNNVFVYVHLIGIRVCLWWVCNCVNEMWMPDTFGAIDDNLVRKRICVVCGNVFWHPIDGSICVGWWWWW